MPSYSVRCPYCGTVKNATQNMQYKCSSCGAVITVGSSGEIKRSKPGN